MTQVTFDEAQKCISTMNDLYDMERQLVDEIQSAFAIVRKTHSKPMEVMADLETDITAKCTAYFEPLIQEQQVKFINI